MSTESEVRLARYRQVEKEADAFGRVIGVRRLKPSEQARLQGMVADVTGFDLAELETGEQIPIPHKVPIMLAAVVCMIDEVLIPFAKNRAELDAIFDRLDREGIEAAGRGVVRLNETDTTRPDDPKDAAKN